MNYLTKEELRLPISESYLQEHQTKCFCIHDKPETTKAYLDTAKQINREFIYEMALMQKEQAEVRYTECREVAII